MSEDKIKLFNAIQVVIDVMECHVDSLTSFNTMNIVIEPLIDELRKKIKADWKYNYRRQMWSTTGLMLKNLIDRKNIVHHRMLIKELRRK